MAQRILILHLSSTHDPSCVPLRPNTISLVRNKGSVRSTSHWKLSQANSQTQSISTLWVTLTFEYVHTENHGRTIGALRHRMDENGQSLLNSAAIAIYLWGTPTFIPRHVIKVPCRHPRSKHWHDSLNNVCKPGPTTLPSATLTTF